MKTTTTTTADRSIMPAPPARPGQGQRDRSRGAKRRFPLVRSLGIALGAGAILRLSESNRTFGVESLADSGASIIFSIGAVGALLLGLHAVSPNSDPTEHGLSPVLDRWRKTSENVPLIGVAGVAASAVLVAVLGTSPRSSDSAILASTNSFLRSGNLSWLLDSQEAPLPHLLIGTLAWLGLDYRHLVLIPLAGSIALVAWCGKEVFDRHQSGALAALAALALAGTPIVTSHFNRLPMYPWFALFGTSGLLLIVRYINHRASTRLLVLGGLLIMLAVTSHGAGLYFAPMAAATVVFVHSASTLKRWAVAMAVVGVWSVPWMVSRFAVGGLSRIASPRDTWVLNEGYLLAVNENYWNYEVGSRLSSLTGQPGVFVDAFGLSAIPLAALAAIGLSGRSRRAQIFCIIGIAMLVAPLSFSRSAGFARYYFALAPGLVILAADGLWRIRRGWVTRRPGFAILALVLTFRLVSSFVPLMEADVSQRPRVAEFDAVAEIVGTEDRVIGYRSMVLTVAELETKTLHQDLVDEATYLALYEWNISELMRLSAEEQVKWVLLTKPIEDVERRYTDTWFEPRYGYPTSYVDQLQAGSCDVFDGDYVVLYELDRCFGP